MGRNVRTIVGDRLLHRSTQSAAISSLLSAANRRISEGGPCAGSAIWGDEPDIPD
jgi:hypothetical protein